MLCWQGNKEADTVAYFVHFICTVRYHSVKNLLQSLTPNKTLLHIAKKKFFLAPTRFWETELNQLVINQNVRENEWWFYCPELSQNLLIILLFTCVTTGWLFCHDNAQDFGENDKPWNSTLLRAPFALWEVCVFQWIYFLFGFWTVRNHPRLVVF